MVQGFRLPGYDYNPRNALIDFSPINNAIKQWGDREQQGVENERQNKLMDFRRQEMDQSNQRFGMEQEKFGLEKQKFASEEALAPDRRRHLQAQTNNLNYRAEPEIVRNLHAAGIDPRSEEGQQLIRNSIKGGGPVDMAIGRMIEQGIGPQPAGPSPPQGAGLGQPQPRFQPQSNVAPQPMPGDDPGIVRTQAAGQPQPGSPPQGRDDPIVQTPMGPMPQSKARMLAFGLAYQGKGEAGKMIAGEASQGALGKEAGNENDKRELKATESLASIKNIRSSYDPKFLSYGTQGKMAWAALVSKAATLKPEQQAELYRFATFRRDSAAEINRAIKENSGATVTEQELKRNLAELPNAGSGIFDGDDPVTFKAKLDRTEEVLALGIARTRYLRKNGFNGDVNAMSNQMPIEQMRATINQRAKQIETELIQQRPGLPREIINREVDMRIKGEFGI